MIFTHARTHARMQACTHSRTHIHIFILTYATLSNSPRAFWIRISKYGSDLPKKSFLSSFCPRNWNSATPIILRASNQSEEERRVMDKHYRAHVRIQQHTSDYGGGVGVVVQKSCTTE